MPKKQKKFRASRQTLEYLAVASSDLYHSTEVEAISHALRYYVEDHLNATDKDFILAGGSVPCAECGRAVDPSDRWVAGHYGEIYHQKCTEEQMIELSGDLHQAQEEAWHGNISNTVEEFLDGGNLGIEEAVDEFIAAYPEMFGEHAPVYEMKMTGSTYTLRELMVGYLERMTE
jgi:hypothetical protein